jgi:hypothetical protein
MQNTGILKLIAKVAGYYENNMKRGFNVQICKCADLHIVRWQNLR